MGKELKKEEYYIPYFVKFGYDNKNVHSVTSEGYFIKRSGKHIKNET